MNGLRPLGLLLTAPLLFSAVPPDDVEDAFNEGVELLQRGRDDEAVAAFRRLLALDPSEDAAFALWNSTDTDVFLDMLTKGGELEKVGKRLLQLVKAGRAAKRDDADAIRELVRTVKNGELSERRRAIGTLSSNHGAFAVPYLLPSLADRGNDEGRVLAMQALTRMSTDVVLPLIAALHSPDEYTRRNVALCLGHIRDKRAVPMLSNVAANDSDGGVRQAAAQALAEFGVSPDPLQALLKQGADYANEAESVLAPHHYSDVLWGWWEGGLNSMPVPRFLYPPMMAMQTYEAARKVDPQSTAAQAGTARGAASIISRIDDVESLGNDVSEYDQILGVTRLALAATGPQAVDLALRESIAASDFGAARGLANALSSHHMPTAGLQAALTNTASSSLRGAAAISLASIAAGSGTPADASVVAELARAAARESQRIAAVIGAGENYAQALRSVGMSVHTFANGAAGLNGVRRLPGVDLIVVADRLADITTDEVLDTLRERERTAESAIVIAASDTDAAEDLYGEKASLIVGSAGDLGDVEELLGELTGERARAETLAADAATALAGLATSGTNCSSAAAALAGTLDRDDAIRLPAMAALAACGSTAQASGIAEVAADESASTEARVQACRALAGIFGRTGTGDPDAVETLTGLARDGELDLRLAALQALSKLDSTLAVRAEIAGT